MAAAVELVYLRKKAREGFSPKKSRMRRIFGGIPSEKQEEETGGHDNEGEHVYFM